MKSFFQYINTHKFFSGALILLMGGGAYFATRPPAPPNYDTAKVAKGSVVQEVSVTGKVNSASEVDLAFERGGRISSEPRPVGTKVKTGDILVRLDASELSALRAQAEANLAYETANLAQLKLGNRVEDVAISEANHASALSTKNDALSTLFDKLSSASTIADDGIFNKTDYLFENPRTISPRAIFPTSDQKLVTSLEQERAELSQSLRKISMIDEEQFVDEWIYANKKYFADVKGYFDGLASAVNAVSPSSQFTQTTIEGWKTNVSLARSNMSAAQSALLLAEQTYRSAESAVLVAQNQLALKRAGPTPESLLAQEAKIAAIRATLDNYDAQIAKMILRAPFDGIITKQYAKKGATVAANAVLVSMQSIGNFQIEVNVPEVDVAKISVGDDAMVTLDAYGADTFFPARVSVIDPAETILEGVSTYKVTLRFQDHDERIRSGMTANIDISTDKREGVLFVPLRSVSTRDGKKYVKILNGLLPREIEVVLGLRGSDGNAEVLSGLNLGDEVITFAPKK